MVEAVFDDEQMRRHVYDIANQDREGIALFTSRCALRVFPFLFWNNEELAYWEEKNRVKYFLGLWRSLLASQRSFPQSDMAKGFAHASALDAADKQNAMGAAYAAYAVAYATDAVQTSVTATTAAADAGLRCEDSAYTMLVPNSNLYHVAQTRDLHTLLNGGVRALTTMPVWQDLTLDSEYERLVEKTFYSGLNALISILPDYSSEQLILSIHKLYFALCNSDIDDKVVVNHIAELDQYLSTFPESKIEKTMFEEGAGVDQLIDEADKPLDISKDDVGGSSSEKKKEQTTTKATDDGIRHTSTKKFSSQDANAVDALDRQKMVDTIAGFLLHPANSGHQTFGLLGDWGVGKSSLVKQLQTALVSRQGEQAYLMGHFNAWAYEHTDNVQAGIAQEMIKALSNPLPYAEDYVETPKKRGAFAQSCLEAGRWLSWLGQRIYLTFGFTVSLHGWKLWRPLVLLLFMVYPMFDMFELWEKKPEPSSQVVSTLNNENSTSKTSGLDLGTGSKIAWSFGFLFFFFRQLKPMLANPMAKELLTYLKLPNFGDHLGSIPVMRETVETLCHRRLTQFGRKQERLLFVVDDLDRCGHEGIVKVFEAVRLVLDIPHVTVIIAVDQRIALAALALHYKELADYHELGNPRAIARDYLAKVIHLPIMLSEPDRKSVNRYLRSIWAQTEDKMPLPKKPMEKPKEKIDAEGEGSTEGIGVIGQAQDGSENASPQKIVEDSLVVEISDNTPSDVASTSGGEDISSGSGTSPEITSQTIINQPEDPELKITPTVIASLSEIQKDAFLYWLEYFDLCNPRQVKRLNNCYNLLRSYYGDESAFGHSGDETVFPIMLALFALEYINGLESFELRSTLKQLIRSGGEEIGVGAEALADVVDRVTLASVDEKFRGIVLEVLYTQLPQNGTLIIDAVEPFVLPAIEGDEPRGDDI